MIKLSPVATAVPATALELAFMVNFKERLCHPYCVDSTSQPQAFVTYKTVSTRLAGSTVFVTIAATVDILVPRNGCPKADALSYTENFDIAFQGNLELPSAVIIESKGRVENGSDVHCGCAHSYSISDSLVVSLKP